MTSVTMGAYCPRCKKITNHGFEIETDYKEYKTISITQNCHNCSLERHTAKIEWYPWQTTHTDYTEWEDPEKC